MIPCPRYNPTTCRPAGAAVCQRCAEVGLRYDAPQGRGPSGSVTPVDRGRGASPSVPGRHRDAGTERRRAASGLLAANQGKGLELTATLLLSGKWCFLVFGR